ncbi:hypothetical protein B0A48_13291 [Cryoendolithus antarcticus]|uniref:PH domain-containing protein n=1 Tax=Cryoendolithus antarcticus TaxID=1507870 RepID=A0A1V8SPT9_9PEZI|nr:hypothetical protein B0A48_13291 [Cryoendolithus antarcticus]
MATDGAQHAAPPHRQRRIRFHRSQTAPARPTASPTAQGPILTPLAVSLLGVEGWLDQPAPPRRPANVNGMTSSSEDRGSRRAQSHYNSFQTVCTAATDDPPKYATAMRYLLPAVGRPCSDVLPTYSCTVSHQARLLMNIESLNPLESATVFESQWREVYLILQGTLLSLHRAKDSGAGKLIISYTLQHAEIGLATDATHTVLVPQTRLAHLIPAPLRQQAWKKDASLFKAEKQTIFRLRVEAEQLLFADPSEAKIIDVVSAISAGIDIAPQIDERSIPRQCTVPRRRRRHRAVFTGTGEADAAAVAEQERILREMYPGFAENGTQPEAQTDTLPEQTTSNPPPPSPTREEDEIDFSTLRETHSTPQTARPTPSRSTSSVSTPSVPAPTSLPPDSNDGKRHPHHPTSASQALRYTRRCLPLLPANAIRASDVIMQHNGTRCVINWWRGELEPWVLQPPSYTLYHAPAEVIAERVELLDRQAEEVEDEPEDDRRGLERLTRQSSNSDSSRTVLDTPGSSREGWLSGEEDIITPLEQAGEGVMESAKGFSIMSRKRPVLVRGTGISKELSGDERRARAEREIERLQSHVALFL